MCIIHEFVCSLCMGKWKKKRVKRGSDASMLQSKQTNPFYLIEAHSHKRIVEFVYRHDVYLCASCVMVSTHKIVLLFRQPPFWTCTLNLFILAGWIDKDTIPKTHILYGFDAFHVTSYSIYAVEIMDFFSLHMCLTIEYVFLVIGDQMINCFLALTFCKIKSQCEVLETSRIMRKTQINLSK